MSNVHVWVAVAAMSVAAPLLAQIGRAPGRVVIRDISVVDVEAGRVLPARDIVVRGTRVERVRAGRRSAAARQDRDRGSRQICDPGPD